MAGAMRDYLPPRPALAAQLHAARPTIWRMSIFTLELPIKQSVKPSRAQRAHFWGWMLPKHAEQQALGIRRKR